MRKALELIRNRKGVICDHDLTAIRQSERARSINQAEAALKAGDVLGENENDKFKDIIDEIKDKTQQYKLNNHRFNQMQNIGKNLFQESKSSLNRECCKAKRNKALSISMNHEELAKTAWNYKDKFDEIDNKISK